MFKSLFFLFLNFPCEKKIFPVNKGGPIFKTEFAEHLGLSSYLGMYARFQHAERPTLQIFFASFY